MFTRWAIGDRARGRVRREGHETWAVLRDTHVERWVARAGEPWDLASAETLMGAHFVYLDWIRADIRGGGQIEISAGDPGQGLRATAGPGRRGAVSTQPNADVSWLPVGRVEGVRLHHVDDNTHPMVVLTLGGRDIAIVAGDVVEEDIVWHDEQVLLFVDPADVDRVPWGNPPRATGVTEIEPRANTRQRR